VQRVKSKNNSYIHHEGHEEKTSQNPFSGPLTLKSVGFFFVVLRVLRGAFLDSFRSVGSFGSLGSIGSVGSVGSQKLGGQEAGRPGCSAAGRNLRCTLGKIGSIPKILWQKTRPYPIFVATLCAFLRFQSFFSSAC
jgi:hypothetical protein